ncbi:elongation factor P 5-aminopentanone reductase [Halobacillus salinus]|uniref:SDR family oxidoreductase n=1 Tax=Halobacillus salinus TaxID=192814 RepID=A0A4Z0H5M7_9BACI|nr:SDR family oxidoreductase [Halobacillus salinus]TGB04741.1 SDR family oxidoreductase [Halobacillus salinus]
MRKRCLIIGASGAIGLATTVKLVEDGWAVACHYRSNEQVIYRLRDQVPSEQWLGAYQGDLSHPEGIQAFLDGMDEEWDALVFCGGQAWTGLFQDMSVADMDQLYYLHVQSTWRITQQALPAMISNKKGHIVVVSSVFGEEGASTEVVYSSVKGAQLSFVKGLAKEVAPSGIRVNAVTPGWIQSEMNAHLSDEEAQMLAEEIPVGRAGQPAEVSGAIRFLMSEEASYITGQTIKVNGGWT